jgi:hypothetical protein
MKDLELVTANTREFLNFLKSKFMLLHQSNFFFRDLHYGTMEFLASKGKKVKYLDAEKIAREAAADLEKKGIFKKIDDQSWLLVYPDFALPRVEKAAPAPAPAPTPGVPVKPAVVPPVSVSFVKA